MSSGSRFENGFLCSSFDDALGELAAFAALGGNAKFAPDIGKGAGASGNCFADLAVGDGFAEADVHRIMCGGQLSCCEEYS